MAMAQPKFIITGSGNLFTAKEDGQTGTVAENQPIQNIINAIRGECNGSCEIQFGNGMLALDIGGSGIEFNDNWGEIALTGEITSNSEEPTIYIYEGVSVTSNANIKNIKNTSDHYGAIRNEGKLIISGGNIEAEYYAVDNNWEGELIISGGNIRAENCAVNNHGYATINDGNIEAVEVGAICNHYTELIINGGNIKAESGAVFNDGDISNGESAFITINGGSIEAEYGAVINSGGEITIIDGSIEAESGAVSNGDGEITIRGGSIKAKTEAVINDGGELTIRGGNIEAIVVAVVNYEGKLTIRGGNIKSMALAVLNLDTKAIALGVLKLIISGGNISIIDGDIPLDLLFDLKDLLEDLLDEELDIEDLIKFAIYNIGNEDYFSLSDNVNIIGNVKSGNKNSTILRSQIANSQINIKTATNTIIFENLPRNAKVEVYNLQGKLISSNSFSQANHGQITVQAKGIYLAKIGSQTFRITVK